MSLSRAEAQQRIFRGWARLSKAMELRDMTESAAQEWERNMLREVHNIFSAVVKGPHEELVVPPLAQALLDAQRCPNKKGPITPANILVLEDNTDLRLPDPSSIDLGDPSTFWWVGLGKTGNGATTHTLSSSIDKGKGKAQGTEESGASSNRWSSSNSVIRLADILGFSKPVEAPPAQSQPMIRKRHVVLDEDEEDELYSSSGEHEAGPSSMQMYTRTRVPKRRCIGRPHDSPGKVKNLHTYVPKCQHCQVTGRDCTVQANRAGWGSCDLCKLKKSRCSAINNPSSHRVVKSTGNSGPQESSRPTPPATTQPLKVGPPGGKWKWEKRAERAAAHNQSRSVDADNTSTSVTKETRLFRSRGEQTDPPMNFDVLLAQHHQLIETVNSLRHEIAVLRTEIKHGAAVKASNIPALTKKLEE